MLTLSSGLNFTFFLVKSSLEIFYKLFSNLLWAGLIQNFHYIGKNVEEHNVAVIQAFMEDDLV